MPKVIKPLDCKFCGSEADDGGDNWGDVSCSNEKCEIYYMVAPRKVWNKLMRCVRDARKYRSNRKNRSAAEREMEGFPKSGWIPDHVAKKRKAEEEVLKALGLSKKKPRRKK
jgi:hypothetical protein